MMAVGTLIRHKMEKIAQKTDDREGHVRVLQ